MKYLMIIILSALSITQLQAQNAIAIINKVDANMNSNTNITKSDMIIHGRRKSRTVTSIVYSKGKNNSFSEYLAPAREKGTKMLKSDGYLWIYSPSTDRTIQLSGHMLKQSLMGSDLSYEDMMENRKLMDMYDAEIIGEDSIEGREVVVILLKAKVDDAIYDSRKTWIDA
ncbi:MAG: outer membrane lipoprotein-sorting protein, partial [Bacteroidetes bacterium 4572_112]